MDNKRFVKTYYSFVVLSRKLHKYDRFGSHMSSNWSIEIN